MKFDTTTEVLREAKNKGYKYCREEQDNVIFDIDDYIFECQEGIEEERQNENTFTINQGAVWLTEGDYLQRQWLVLYKEEDLK